MQHPQLRNTHSGSVTCKACAKSLPIMQARSVSQASSVAQYSPNMSELLGFLPTPKTQPDAPTGQDPRQKPSSASSYSFGVRERAGASPRLSPLRRQKAPLMSQNCLHIGKSLRKQRRLYCIVAQDGNLGVIQPSAALSVSLFRQPASSCS